MPLSKEELCMRHTKYQDTWIDSESGKNGQSELYTLEIHIFWISDTCLATITNLIKFMALSTIIDGLEMIILKHVEKRITNYTNMKNTCWSGNLDTCYN